MSWSLGGVAIRSAHKKTVDPNVVQSTKRTLSGRYTRDFIGSKKTIIECTWNPIYKEDYDTIMAAYDAQVATGANYALVIDETGFSFSGNVLVVISPFEFSIANHYEMRDFSVKFIEQ